MLKNFFITLLSILFINSANAEQIKIISDKLEIIRAENIEIFSSLIISSLSDIIFICLALAVLTNKTNKKIIKKFLSIN